MMYSNLSVEDKARVDSVSSINVGVVRLIADILSVHGDDERTLEITAAGLFGALSSINKVDNRMIPLMLAMIANSNEVDLAELESPPSGKKVKYDA